MPKLTSLLPEVSDIDNALKILVGETVARPKGGTLAGHAAGLPFEDLVHDTLEKKYGERVKRHFDALNSIFLASKHVRDYEGRLKLLGPQSLQFLLKRGKKAITDWSPTNLFEVKQNDTAESILFPDTRCEFKPDGVLLIDVKTQDADKSSQAPNIMSGDKLARACVLALNDDKEPPFDFLYVGVKWRKEQKSLRCTEIKTISIMKIDPKEIYINWVAAQQIQFHPFDVVQNYKKNKRDWCKSYLSVFCDSLDSRISKESEKLAMFRKAISK